MGPQGVDGPDQSPAVFIGDLRMRKADLFLQVFQRRVIQVDLPFERAIGDALTTPEQIHDLVQHLVKVHPSPLRIACFRSDTIVIVQHSRTVMTAPYIGIWHNIFNISPSEALPVTLEVIHMLWGEVQPKCFSGMHRLLEFHFSTEGAVTMPQVQDLGCTCHRHFDHINDAG